MIERLSHEPASVPDEDDGRAARQQMLELLRVRLSHAVSEGLEPASVAGQTAEIDSADIAAFLDGSLSPTERDTLIARLVNDPSARAELAAAAALLDEIKAEPVPVPPDLMGRAAGILAAREQERPPVSAATIAAAAWYRRSIVWPGLAFAVVAIAAVPAVWKAVGVGTTAVEQSGSGDTFGRGIVAVPSVSKKDAASCDAAGSTTKQDAERRGEAADKNDRCAPKPPAAARHDR
jgi:anti-sigma factor RsiW